MANIDGNNPPVLNDTDYVDKIKNSLDAIDDHDHSSTKGVQIPTGGIADLAVTTGKLAAGAVTAAKLAAGAADSAALGITGSVVGTTDTQTLTNKSLQDSTTSIVDNSDATKKMKFEVSGVTTGTTRTVTMPDADLTMVGVATTQTLTNKTLTSPTLTTPTIDVAHMTDQGSTPATPSSGTTKVYSKTDGKVYKLTSAGVEQELGAGAGGGIKNYISANPDAETATTGWATYKDAAASTPVDGTGGSATLTFTRSTSSPLRGTGSFLVTTTAANLQGEGASYDFTLDAADKAKVLSISFDYSVDVTTTTGDFAVYIYDVTNSTLIQPAGYQVQGGVSGTSYKHIATFQTSSSGTSYRLIIHRAVTTATATNLKIDNVVVGPQVVQYGAPVTDWVSYTPTFGMTAQTTTGAWRRVGDTMEIRAFVDFSGGSSGSPTISLPSGYTIDTAKLVDTTNRNIGTATINESGQYDVVVRYNSTTTGILVALGASGTYLNEPAIVSATIPATITAASYIQISFSVPISGWSSSVQMSNDTDTRVVAFTANAATATVTSSLSDVSWTSQKDTHGAFNGTTSYTIPVSGQYFVEASLRVNAVSCSEGTNATISILKNGSSVAQSVVTLAAMTASANSMPMVDKILDLVAGDVIKVQVASGATTPTISATAILNNFSIMRISGPSAIAASETVAARYYTTNTNSTASGASDTIENWTKVYDTHDSFVAATGIFTVPVAGKYRISCGFSTASIAWTTGTNRYLTCSVAGTSTIQMPPAIVWASITNYIGFGGSTTQNYNAGDTIRIVMNNATGSTVTLDAGANDNWICIERVGN